MHLKIFGRVQGVGYRNWAHQQAMKFSLSGWVRNCSDGSVEAEVQGRTKNVEQFIAACEQGPAIAQVRDIKKNPLQTLKPEEGKMFEIRY